jgi:ketosteroid isomerase-like protein
MSQENVESPSGVRVSIAPLSERASQSRTLDERVFVHFPTMYRRTADAMMRLSPRSRLRRSIVTRLVGRAYAATNRRDLEVSLLGLDPAIELRPQRDLLPPDKDPVLRGREAYRQFVEDWFGSFENLRLEPQEFFDMGDTLLVAIRWKGRGSGSGIAFDQPMFQLFHLQRGLIVKQEDFGDRVAALEAVGLSE